MVQCRDMESSSRKPATKEQCRVCNATISTSGFAATAHQKSAGHIAGLISQGRTEEAATLQIRADIDAKNRRTARAQAQASPAEQEVERLRETCALVLGALQDAVGSTGGALIVQDYERLNRALIAGGRFARA